MVTTQSFEEQLRKLISEVKIELSAKQAKKEELDREIESLKREMDGAETTLRGYLKRSGKLEQSHVNWEQLLVGTKTHKDQIIVVVKQMGGIAKPSPITDVLYSNGFIKSKKRPNAYIIVQRGLADLVDEGKMEKSKSGEYKLIGVQPMLAAESPTDRVKIGVPSVQGEKVTDYPTISDRPHITT